MKDKKYYVYILSNKRNTVLYTGVTDNLERRIFEHNTQEDNDKSFAKRYNINKLVYYERFDSPESAIVAEKKIKGWTREKKIELIDSINPDFRDLLLF
jgi:putative endonuclease